MHPLRSHHHHVHTPPGWGWGAEWPCRFPGKRRFEMLRITLLPKRQTGSRLQTHPHQEGTQGLPHADVLLHLNTHPQQHNLDLFHFSILKGLKNVSFPPPQLYHIYIAHSKYSWKKYLLSCLGQAGCNWLICEIEIEWTGSVKLADSSVLKHSCSSIEINCDT